MLAPGPGAAAAGRHQPDKAFFAGRPGPPLLQPYYDLAKLLRKGAVYSRTTTLGVPRRAVVGARGRARGAGCSCRSAARAAPLAFPGDLVLFAYLLGLARFFTVLAALDTGSSFEGMGASREVAFSALAEPALLLALAALARRRGQPVARRRSTRRCGPATLWAARARSLALVAAALLVVSWPRTPRIPVDDPNTHLELTMIHEVMVLDHSGPDLAFIHYGAALKLWVLGALLVADRCSRSRRQRARGRTWRRRRSGLLGWPWSSASIESTMARLRLRARAAAAGRRRSRWPRWPRPVLLR